MKDSGIKWLGSIPDNWEIKKIKYVLQERIEKNNPIKSTEILSLTAKQGVIPYSEKEGGGNKPKEDFSQYRLAYPGDIVMNSMNILSGSVGLSKYFGCVSPVYYMLRPYNEEDDVRFFNYIFQSTVFQRSLLGLGNGILMKESDNGTLNTIRMRIPMEKFGNLYIPITSSTEQKKIADFLDEKCDEIAILIADLNEEISTLEQYKHSVITEKVYSGLDNNVEFCDSGIDLVESIPKNWSTNRLKHIFEFGKGLNITKENLLETGIPVISYGQIHSKLNNGVEIDASLIRYVSENYLKHSKSSLVNKGDFIFADTSEDLVGCGNCVYVNEQMTLFAGYHTIILKAVKNVENRYFAYLFKTDLWRKQIREKVNGVKLFSITQKILKETTVIIPPEEEQTKISNFLDTVCNEIDAVIKEKQEQISTLEQYKKTIIYEYTTGKKEVV